MLFNKTSYFKKKKNTCQAELSQTNFKNNAYIYIIVFVKVKTSDKPEEGCN
jgi:glycopeptide antibiotics resistance protein